MPTTSEKTVKGLRRVKSLAGRGVRSLYRRLLAAHYAGSVSEVPNSPPHSVLVIRGDGGIGDFVLFLPALHILRRHYADARLSLLVGSESEELATGFAPVDEVISFDVKRYRHHLGYRIGLIKNLRSRHFDSAINPIYSREPLTDELLYCCGARERIASEGNLNNIDARTKAANNRNCTRILAASPRLIHESERNREFVERLIGTRLIGEDYRPSLLLSESLLKEACALLGGQGLDPHRDLIVVLCPGALNPIRMWPAERFAQLADLIVHHFGARILLCGSASDKQMAEMISRLTCIAPASLVGKITLRQLAGVLHSSALYIGNESGPLHLAVASGTPTVCILGGGHFGRFYPYPGANRHRAVFETMPCYHCNWQCIYEEPHCIRDIAIDQAWKTVRGLMEEIVIPAKASRVEESVRSVQ